MILTLHASLSVGHRLWRKGERTMTQVRPYDRSAAVNYAHRWAMGRNPAYYNFDDLGGDCTNFASQCLYAGAGVMNFTPDFGWYYQNVNRRAPAWTGVIYLWNFLTRKGRTPGPFAAPASLGELEPGDLVQLRFSAEKPFSHCPVVVSVLSPDPEGILVAAHSDDSDFRPLSSYPYEALRGLHILGTRR